MRTIRFEGSNLRVWSAGELERVRKNVGRDGDVRLASAADSLTLTWESACHPALSMDHNPEHLIAEYHKADRVLVLRCHQCRKPVMAFEVV